MAYDQDEDHFELFSALQDLRTCSEPEPSHTRSIPAALVIAYASREGSVVDLRLERLIRAQPRARAIYGGAMQRRATAFSPVAVAAGSGAIRTRLVGPHRLELIDEEDMTYLVVHLDGAADPVEWIEVRAQDGQGGRVQIGKAVRNVLQLPLDHRYPELKAIDEAIRHPDCQIYLWP